jgi:pantoate--beta-alanine ligase
MQVAKNITELRQAIDKARKANLSVGLVPTMGCLHEGHLSLIKKAKTESSFVVVSIFVNPTQFAPHEDFSKYPRTFPDDQALCEKAGVNLIFAPSVEDFYATDASTWVDVDQVSDGLCGTFRPGHFRGVATVVAMLFNAVQPQVAIFGRKDLQQLAVIKRMVRDLHFPVKIIAHETVREANGVALSSRNRYLSATELKQAAAIPGALQKAKSLFQSGEKRSSIILAIARDHLATEPSIALQYLTIVDRESMAVVETVTPDRCTIALACHLGKTRLIDNLDL